MMVSGWLCPCLLPLCVGTAFGLSSLPRGPAYRPLRVWACLGIGCQFAAMAALFTYLYAEDGGGGVNSAVAWLRGCWFPIVEVSCSVLGAAGVASLAVAFRSLPSSPDR